MLIQTLTMPAFSGVAAGQTALAKLPIGNRYHGLLLSYSGVTLAQMTEIRVKANGSVIHRYSATERDTMNQFDGLPAASGFLAINFDRVGLKSRTAEEVTALNTGSINSKNGESIGALNIEIDVASGAAGPALSLIARVSNSVPGGPGTVMRVDKTTRNLGSAGENQIGDMPYGTAPFAAVNRVFIATANCTELTVKRGLVDIFKRTAAQNNALQNAFGIRSPQSGYYVLDPSEQGYGGEAINTLGYQDFRYVLQESAGESVTLLTEYLGSLGA